MRGLLDTCIVIDALQKREPFWHSAETIFINVGTGKYTGCISAKSAADIHYLMHKNLHSEEKTRNLLRALFTLFEVVDTTGQNCVDSVDAKISDYEDALQIESAVSSNIDCIVTRNISDFKDSTLPVFLPMNFWKNSKKNLRCFMTTCEAII